MDHYNCDVIIKVLSNVLSRLIDVNKVRFAPITYISTLYTQSHVGKQLITKFQSSYPPEVSIHAYLERIKKYAGCSDSCFVVALIYIDRMIEIRNVVLTSLNVHRLIITR
jgi:Cyclin